MPHNDYSDFGAEGDQDSDQLEMQVIYDQQQRNDSCIWMSEGADVCWLSTGIKCLINLLFWCITPKIQQGNPK